MLALVVGCFQDSSGFVGVQTLASAHVLHLPTNSVQIFQVGQTFGPWVKSKTSLHRGECKYDEARGSAFRVGFWG